MIQKKFIEFDWDKKASHYIERPLINKVNFLLVWDYIIPGIPPIPPIPPISGIAGAAVSS